MLPKDVYVFGQQENARRKMNGRLGMVFERRWRNGVSTLLLLKTESQCWCVQQQKEVCRNSVGRQCPLQNKSTHCVLSKRNSGIERWILSAAKIISWEYSGAKKGVSSECLHKKDYCPSSLASGCRKGWYLMVSPVLYYHQYGSALTAAGGQAVIEGVAEGLGGF